MALRTERILKNGEDTMSRQERRIAKRTLTRRRAATATATATTRRVVPPAPRRGGLQLPLHSDEQVITLVIDKNPKREGSDAQYRFGLYRNGMTVRDYLNAGGTRDDLRWDAAHGFIQIL